MIDRKPNRFPCLVTAATQETLANPAWPYCLANWQQRCDRVRVLIPATAKVDEKREGHYVRMKGDQVMLADVVEWIVKAMDPQHAQAIICDPLVVFHASIKQLIDPAFMVRHNLNAGWMATGNAIKIDQAGFGDTYEEEVLRWFAGGANAFKVLANNAHVDGTPYISRSVPFTAPLWSGYFAGLCQAKVTEPRYFNVSNLKIAGSAMPAPGEYDPTGFQYFATNTPTRSYPELVPVEA